MDARKQAAQFMQAIDLNAAQRAQPLHRWQEALVPFGLPWGHDRRMKGVLRKGVQRCSDESLGQIEAGMQHRPSNYLKVLLQLAQKASCQQQVMLAQVSVTCMTCADRQSLQNCRDRQAARSTRRKMACTVGCVIKDVVLACLYRPAQRCIWPPEQMPVFLSGNPPPVPASAPGPPSHPQPPAQTEYNQAPSWQTNCW